MSGDRIPNKLPPGFLSLTDHVDLARKVARELAGYQDRHPEDDGVALNICLSLAHWPEWFIRSPLAKERGFSDKDQIFEKYEVFRDCRHLANGGKHHTLRETAPRNLPVARTAASYDHNAGYSSVVIHSTAGPARYMTLRTLMHQGFEAIVQITGLPWETLDCGGIRASAPTDPAQK